MLKRILVPLDTSKLSEAILPYVREFQKALGSQITLLAIVEPWRYATNPEL